MHIQLKPDVAVELKKRVGEETTVPRLANRLLREALKLPAPVKMKRAK